MIFFNKMIKRKEKCVLQTTIERILIEEGLITGK